MDRYKLGLSDFFFGIFAPIRYRVLCPKKYRDPIPSTLPKKYRDPIPTTDNCLIFQLKTKVQTFGLPSESCSIGYVGRLFCYLPSGYSSIAHTYSSGVLTAYNGSLKCRFRMHGNTLVVQLSCLSSFFVGPSSTRYRYRYSADTWKVSDEYRYPTQYSASVPIRYYRTTLIQTPISDNPAP